MYNLRLKSEYRFAYDRTYVSYFDNFIVEFFNKTEALERIAHCDLYAMDYDAISEVVKKSCMRSSYPWTRVYLLRSYIAWCRSRKLSDYSNAIFKIGFPDVEDTRRKKLANPIHLHTYLNQLFRNESSHSVSNIYRCFAWLLYLGVHKEDTVQLKKTDIDLDKRLIHYQGGKIPIPDIAYKSFVNSVKADSIITYDNSKMGVVIERQWDRGSSDLLLSGTKGTATAHNMRSGFAKKIKDRSQFVFNVTPSFSDIYWSGLYYRAYQIESAGGDFRGFLNSSVVCESNMYIKRRTKDEITPDDKEMSLRNFLEDYAKWKLAFGI